MQDADIDARHLERCVSLAQEALEAGDEPFGSVLVGADGRVLHEARNRANTGDPTEHPEFALARWAARNLSPEDRRAATVYTSGEHCPMCAAAHGWAGLGRIVYASSSAQLGAWMAEWGAAPGPVETLPIQKIASGVPVTGPVAGFDDRIRELHRRLHGG
ncbi:nucleoside deaminase [Palleronia sediminis]|uniref:Nucleoside deaminase n=1 Tax=Palleronia sediminis TaxID=2547833 RepID=A0A4R6AA03_9RHOB|nr:nucleoside deaminase [Palleronia sediminis]TDL78086.1 nucleoside deaminase [Palleronia sediminis]